MLDLIDVVGTRYSTKAYDASRTIPEDDIQTLKGVLRMAPSSTNLQPWYLVIAGSEVGKARVAKATDEAYPFNSPKITRASHVVVFAARLDADDAYLNGLLDQEEADGRFAADPEKFRADMDRGRRGFIDQHRLKLKDTRHWMDKQVYLNLGQFLLAAAMLGIDTTPMEGVDTDVLDAEFGLREKGYGSVAIVSLGYHAEDDFNATLPKSRLPESVIMETV